jgi:hypothetical protein
MVTGLTIVDLGLQGSLSLLEMKRRKHTYLKELSQMLS